MVRVISRLNVGGPAIQAISMSRRLVERGYDTTLVRGVEGPGEGSLDDLAQELDVSPVLIPDLRRELGRHDLAAIRGVLGIIRRERPQILHTHAAKAGTVGRIAASLAGGARPPVRIHTFHGHVLTGYFSPPKERAFRTVEQVLARGTTKLVAVSEEVRDDLLRLGIARPRSIEVIRLGFDLTRFELSDADATEARRSIRNELGIPEEGQVVTLIARLVPIKRVDRFLEMAGHLAGRPGTTFLVVGDGELKDALTESPAASALGNALVWAGLRRDIPKILASSDLVCLTSDNEGTPVSLIEAQAASRPVVSTDVGGVPTVVEDGVSGDLVAPEAAERFSERVARLLDEPERCRRYVAEGRRTVFERFSQERLVDDLDRLYASCLP